MTTVLCPACYSPMEIEDNDSNTEWECPTCEAGFLVERASDGNLRRVLTTPGKGIAEQPMIATTGNEVAGRSIASYIGIVRGIVVRSPSIAQGIMGGLKQIVGGNIESYAEVCETARDEAYQRMMQHAREKGADAIIAMRYDATEFSQNVTEVLAYGTAVKLAEPPRESGASSHNIKSA
jgi:uncharacterized protein YbjQ (UPF0145 family)